MTAERWNKHTLVIALQLRVTLVKGPEAVTYFQVRGLEGRRKLSVPGPPAFSGVAIGPLPRRSLPEVVCQ